MKIKYNRIQAFLLSILFMVLAALSIFAQHSRFGINEDNLSSKQLWKLPKHIPIYEDQIYLFADYDNVANNIIPIYIINTTQDTFRYSGSKAAMLQQEFMDTSDSWVRSTSFYYGWSGTPYLWFDGIRPHEFNIIKKIFPDSGETHKIRFNFLTTSIIPSNTGKGFVNEKEAKEAEFDDIALLTSGADFLIKIINGELIPFETEPESKGLVRRAIVKLASSYPDEAIPVLKTFADDPNSEYKDQAIANLNKIGKRKQMNKKPGI